METNPELNYLSAWLLSYGSFALFGLLALGIVALPVPEETLMVLAGILMKSGHLHEGETLVAAYAGSMCGITASYLVGRTAGYYAVHRYGRWVGIQEKHLIYAHNWFEHYGTWALFFGYFVPGVRHFTGFLAGTTELDYREFALFAYFGALVWVSVFLSVGYFFGNYGLSLFSSIEQHAGKMGIAAVLILVIAGLAIWWKRRDTTRG